jgi:hypothetical protein
MEASKVSTAATSSALPRRYYEELFFEEPPAPSGATLGGQIPYFLKCLPTGFQKGPSGALIYTVLPTVPSAQLQHGVATAITPFIYVANLPTPEVEAPLIDPLPRMAKVLRLGLKPLRQLEPRRPNITALLLAADEE